MTASWTACESAVAIRRQASPAEPFEKVHGLTASRLENMIDSKPCAPVPRISRPPRHGVSSARTEVCRKRSRYGLDAFLMQPAHLTAVDDDFVLVPQTGNPRSTLVRGTAHLIRELQSLHEHVCERPDYPDTERDQHPSAARLGPSSDD